MANLPPPPPPPPSSPRRPRFLRQRSSEGGGDKRNMPRWAVWALIAFAAVLIVGPRLMPTPERTRLTYTEFLELVESGEVRQVSINNLNNQISGTLADGRDFITTGATMLSDADEQLLKSKGVDYDYSTPQGNFFTNLIPILLPFFLIMAFFLWMQRRAMGQAGNIMSIGRSRAKPYQADKPSTTFADIAGYEGVKQEIREVVDFLRMPERFKEIGARVPKGVLLVGPPGTGKTLFARAVAGEAGVGFLSVTGSDFMEMFVGVGASRVRDLFQQARKMGRAIIFIDEIDSIGRKRGAGLGGGHDEREQTLNQMLSEMDGFESSEGVVVMAATNRPDILDAALLRPGRFDRQIIVPLPEAEERHAILKVHSAGKRIGTDV
ncbi:MAG: ATP-dependent metallopeptidase FtsH/Yme1/Tma family protein, partial [Actinobacteria bacterium]|nr:ATP-dependent metallopeptidase FtsH/Yme1/Tma family protein [Actinomycetota bacterium]